MLDNLKRFPRMFSVWMASLVPLWMAMPADIKAMIPPELEPYLPLVWMAAWSIARAKPQGEK